MQTETTTIMDATEAFAVPGEDSLIDCLRPDGRTFIYGSTLEEIRERYPTAERINIADWSKAKADRQDTPVIWSEVTRDRYWEMLEVLPPAAYLPVAETGYFPTITAGFLVGEPWDHHATTGAPRYAAFIKRGTNGVKFTDAKYYESDRPLTRKEFNLIASL